MILAAALARQAAAGGVWALNPYIFNSADSGGTVDRGGLRHQTPITKSGRVTGIITGKQLMHFYLAADPGGAGLSVGISKATVSTSSWFGNSADGYAYNAVDGKVYNNAVGSTGYGTSAVGDIVTIAFDVATGSMYVAKNGSWLNSGNPLTGAGAVVTGLTGDWYFTSGNGDGSPGTSIVISHGLFAGF